MLVGRLNNEFGLIMTHLLAELNRKIDSIITLLETQDFTILNILQNPKGNNLEQMGETS